MIEFLIGAAILALFMVMFFFGVILEDRGDVMTNYWPEDD